MEEEGGRERGREGEERLDNKNQVIGIKFKVKD